MDVIIQKDEEILNILGITHQQIAQAIDDTIHYRSPLPHLSTNDYRTLGDQNCPFGDGETGAHDYKISNTINKHSINVAGLHPHLIAVHHFFEGKGTPYRVDPLEAILTFEIQSSAHTTEEIEEMFYQELVEDLTTGEHYDAVEHALHKLQLYTKHDNLPDILSNAVSHFKPPLFDLLIPSLISLARRLPEVAAEPVFKKIITLQEQENSKDISSGAQTSLQTLKRQINNETYPIMMAKLYWPDYIDRWKKNLYSEKEIAICIDYVEQRGLTSYEDLFSQYEGILTDYLAVDVSNFKNDAIARMHIETVKENIAREPSKKQRFFQKAIEMDNYIPFTKLEQYLPYFTIDEASEKTLRDRLNFYNFACDYFSLQVEPEKLLPFLLKRAETLHQLEQTDEATYSFQEARLLYIALSEDQRYSSDIDPGLKERLKDL